MVRTILGGLLILAILVFGWPKPILGESLKKRHRLEIRIGWNQGGRNAESGQPGLVGIRTNVESGNILGAVSYWHWAQENLAFGLTVSALSSGVSTTVGPLGVSDDVTTVASIFLGARYYIAQPSIGETFRPYLAVGLGPYVGSGVVNRVGFQIASEVKTLGSFGGHLGAGVDIPVSRHFMLGANAGYNLMADFSEQLGDRRNFSGFEVGIGLSWVFGKGVKSGS